MPLTLDYLESIHENWFVTDFSFHNIIGDDTIENQMPVLLDEKPL